MTGARLTKPQEGVLYAVACGSRGVGSHPRTLEALRKRGLIRGMEGRLPDGGSGWVWFATPAGDAAYEYLQEAR